MATEVRASLCDVIPLMHQRLDKYSRRSLRTCCRELHSLVDTFIDTLTVDESEIARGHVTSARHHRPWAGVIEQALCGLGAILSRPNIQPTCLHVILAGNTAILDKGERILSIFSACRSLVSVRLTDKLLTPTAARALLDAVPGLQQLRLEHTSTLSYVWGDDDDIDEEAVMDEDYTDAISAASKGLPLVLLQQGPKLTCLEVSDRCSLADTTTRHLAACTRLQRLKVSLQRSAITSLASLHSLQSLSVSLPVKRLSTRSADLTPLQALTALTKLELSTASRQVSEYKSLLRTLPDDVSPLAGLPSLVELSLPDSVLGGEELRALEPLTALTSLRVQTIKVTRSRRQGHGNGVSTRPEVAAAAPLSWPLPPSLRRLSTKLAEVAALAALRSPPSLSEVDVGTDNSFQSSGVFFGRDSVAEDVVDWCVQPGCGAAIRGAVGLLAGRLPAYDKQALCVCLPDKFGHLSGNDVDGSEHREWIAELGPLGLRSLYLHRLELGARDVLALAAAVPTLEKLVLSHCDMLPDVLPLLRRCRKLRELVIGCLEAWRLDEPEQLRCHLLALCMDAPVLWDVSIEMEDEGDVEDMRDSVTDWVEEQLRDLGNQRVSISVYDI